MRAQDGPGTTPVPPRVCAATSPTKDAEPRHECVLAKL
ncbi:Hypothetical protein CAP_3846 [Chondromyces apiculatus DSM 436]|uniref:Uncharacterized protein n=1 Tax=Chondromyces apiculatus DSM 436 TaxID=1192034 RepID=A0A017T7N2_9BACT|nr:Hypothetical protein CAP_3846 [Chondromyces apiculatus DSM 436]